MSKQPNPQGKGLAPLLDNLLACRPRVAVPAKHIEQITRELFTSLFVLESEFRFRPVVGRAYWLYRQGERFRLSLVSPAEWSGAGPLGQAVGECMLQPDLTWTLQMSDAAAADGALLRLIEQRRQQLERQLETVCSVADVLPVFESRLPFYQRLFAAGLAHSLGVSMQRGGLTGLSYRQAQGLLEGPGAAAGGDT
jgi:hypothetical protein